MYAVTTAPSRNRWSRRAALGLGLGLVAAAGLPHRAEAGLVSVGELQFTTPPTITPPGTMTAPGTVPVVGAGWQWVGQSGSTGGVPATVVLARNDLAATDATEVLGLLLAGSVNGLLPDLALQPSRSRAMPGGGEQTRVDVAYTVATQVTYHGTVLIATRERTPAGLLAVLGIDALTAGGIEGILSSARWRR